MGGGGVGSGVRLRKRPEAWTLDLFCNRCAQGATTWLLDSIRPRSMSLKRRPAWRLDMAGGLCLEMLTVARAVGVSGCLIEAAFDGVDADVCRVACYPCPNSAPEPSCWTMWHY